MDFQKMEIFWKFGAPEFIDSWGETIGYENFYSKIVVSPRRNSFREPKDPPWRFYLQPSGGSLGATGATLGATGGHQGCPGTSQEAPWRSPVAPNDSQGDPKRPNLGFPKGISNFMVSLRDTQRVYMSLLSRHILLMSLFSRHIDTLCVCLSKPWKSLIS